MSARTTCNTAVAVMVGGVQLPGQLVKQTNVTEGKRAHAHNAYALQRQSGMLVGGGWKYFFSNPLAYLHIHLSTKDLRDHRDGTQPFRWAEGESEMWERE